MLSYTKAGAPCNTIRADLIDADTCSAAGITATGNAPVLVLCRQLLAASLDPDSALAVYRNGTLALHVRSLREGAQLRVAPHGVGFQWVKECTAASPISQSAEVPADDRTDGPARFPQSPVPSHARQQSEPACSP